MQEWAKEALSAEEYDDFIRLEALNAARWLSYETEGKIKVFKKYEKIFVAEFNSEIDVPVSRIDESVPPFDIRLLDCEPDFLKYRDRYFNDYPESSIIS
jgi:hypothetical protein